MFYMLWLSESRKDCSPILYVVYIIVNQMVCGVGEAVAFNSFIYVLNIGHFSINILVFSIYELE